MELVIAAVAVVILLAAARAFLASDTWAAAKLQAETRAGRKSWGRQPGGPEEVGSVVSPHRATLAIRVIRADGSVEDLGIVSEQVVDMTPEALEALRLAATHGPVEEG